MTKPGKKLLNQIQSFLFSLAPVKFSFCITTSLGHLSSETICLIIHYLFQSILSSLIIPFFYPFYLNYIFRKAICRNNNLYLITFKNILLSSLSIYNIISNFHPC